MARKKKDEKPTERKELKRPNGMGSVYKLQGRRRKPWIVRVTNGSHIENEGTDQAKKVYDKITVGYYETETEAKKVLSGINNGVIVPKQGITLEELYNEWIKTKSRSSYKAMNGYRTGWNHLKKYYKTNFNDLRTTHLQEIIDNNAEMSRPLLVKIKSLLSMLYKYAMQNDICNKNYAEFIQMPKATRKERLRFTDLDIKRLEELAKTDDMAQLILVLIYTGLRINELLALTKFNIDLDKRIITGGGKTESGTNRVIPIHNKILPYLKNWYNREHFIFVYGKVRSYDSIAKQFKTFKQNNNFDDSLTLHCTRHTFASMLAENKVDPIYITKVMGHSNYNLTAKTYTHLDAEAMLKEINKI